MDMIYRLLGKFFFLFYICPRIAREFRLARKWLNPIINDAIVKLADTEKEKLAQSRANHPAGSRRPQA